MNNDEWKEKLAAKHAQPKSPHPAEAWERQGPPRPIQAPIDDFSMGRDLSHRILDCVEDRIRNLELALKWALPVIREWAGIENNEKWPAIMTKIERVEHYNRIAQELRGDHTGVQSQAQQNRRARP